MSKPARDKLYPEPIKIEVRPFAGFINKWIAETEWMERPYQNWGYGGKLQAYGKTAEDALEKLKDKLCKVTEKEEAKHASHREWHAGIKETTFSREDDCCSVKPRPRPFS